MPGFNPFRYRFPYTNINDINLDWIIKKVRKLSEDVAAINPERIEEVLQQAAAAEQTAQNALATAESVSGIAADAESVARAAQDTANNAADSAQAAGTAAAAAQTTANNAADSAQAAGTAAAAAQTTANQNRATIAIVETGSTATQNIAAGQYVIWKGTLYKASSAIASGATLSSSNLTAVTGGGLNDLRKDLSLSARQTATLSASASGGNTASITIAWRTYGKIVGLSVNVSPVEAMPPGITGRLIVNLASTGIPLPAISGTGGDIAPFNSTFLTSGELRVQNNTTTNRGTPFDQQILYVSV